MNTRPSTTKILTMPMPMPIGNCHKTANATPSNVPCAKASAKNAMRRHKTRQPKGAESGAKMLPAIQAGAMMANQAVIIDIRNVFIKGTRQFCLKSLVFLIISRLEHGAHKRAADAHKAAHNDGQKASETPN